MLPEKRFANAPARQGGFFNSIDQLTTKERYNEQQTNYHQEKGIEEEANALVWIVLLWIELVITRRYLDKLDSGFFIGLNTRPNRDYQKGKVRHEQRITFMP